MNAKPDLTKKPLFAVLFNDP